MLFRYAGVIAINPNTDQTEIVKSATGTIHLDENWDIPVEVHDVNGFAMTTLNTTVEGLFPDFYVEGHPVVGFQTSSGHRFYLRSSTPVPGPTGPVPVGVTAPEGALMFEYPDGTVVPGPALPPPAELVDDDLAILVQSSTSATKGALDAEYQALTYIDPEKYRKDTDVSDYECIQAAVNAAATFGIKEVRLKKPNYTLRRGINFNGVHNLTIRGTGRNSTEIFVPGTPTNTQVDSVFWTSGPCSNLHFSGFKVKGTVVDDATGPRRARVFSPTPGYSQAFTFRGDLIPDANGVTPNAAYPVVRDIVITDVFIDGSRTLPFLFSGVRGGAEAHNVEFRNTMDPGWTDCERVVASNLVSVLSSDNGFSFSRGNHSVIATNLYAIDCAYYGLWVAGFNTNESGSKIGPRNFAISNVNVINAGEGGVLLDNAPKHGKISNIFVNGVLRGPSDEPNASAGVGIRFGGFPSGDRTNPTDYAQNIEIDGFTLINCAKGGIQPTGTMDVAVRNGIIINAGSATDHVGVAVSSTDSTQNFGIGTAGVAAGTVRRFNASNIKVIDNRATPLTNYPIFLDGADGAEWTAITAHGARRGFLSDAVAFERRYQGTHIFNSMVSLILGATAGSNAGTGVVRGYVTNGAAGSRRQMSKATTAGVDRWDIAASGDAEGGSNAGSNLVFAAYADNGAKLQDVATARRSDGRWTFHAPAQLKAHTSATRPSASAFGAGAMIYDTTLSLPMFSDGAVWRDAAGNAV